MIRPAALKGGIEAMISGEKIVQYLDPGIIHSDG
jgi:hypothetical protein